jgi:hypothetical protein
MPPASTVENQVNQENQIMAKAEPEKKDEKPLPPWMKGKEKGEAKGKGKPAGKGKAKKK